MSPDSPLEQTTSLRQVDAVIEGLVHAGRATARSDGSVHELFPVAASPREGEALRDWVRRAGATRTIEIGLGYGISALYICAGLLENCSAASRHVVMDTNQGTRFADCGLQVLNEAGLTDIVEYYDEGSQTVLPRLLSEGRRFDLAFVDGNHRFDGVFVDLFYLGRLLQPGGIVVVDDYQLPGVSRAVSFFLTNLDWTLQEASQPDEDHQWGVVRTATIPDMRPFKYFLDF